MKVRRNKTRGPAVVWAVSGAMLLGIGILGAELWKLQVRRKSGFDEIFSNQSVRRVRLPAVRGKIHDARGACLADSVPNYCIAIYTAELREPRSVLANTLELLHEIWARTGVKPDIGYRDIQRHLALHPAEPLVAWRDLDAAAAARWRARFEEWTAPPPGSLRRRRIPGLDLGKPLQGRSIAIRTGELARRPTTTAANTLELVYEISERIGVPRQVRFQDIKDHIFAQRPLPLLAWRNIDEQTMARWADTCAGLAGTDIYYLPARTYPEGDLLAHLVGYTLEADAAGQAESGERIHFDLRGIEGKKGLEGVYNALLEGSPGYQLVQIDAMGYHHRDLQYRPPRPGGDLDLTLDAAIQRFADEALALRQDGEDPAAPVRGAVVVLDPNNGDVLAMAASPSFDPNLYMGSKSYRQALLRDPLSRTFNRAVFGQYPPGSIFKPIVALGALQALPDYGATLHDCRGSLTVSGRRMNCWIHRTGRHGEIDLHEALMHSCNVYMFEMAQAAGYAPIRAMAAQFGLGQHAGLFPDLDAPPEQKDLAYGNLPQKDANRIDLCNLSIGQGALTASPLQMAMAAAALANGGTLYRPRLVKKWRAGPGEPYNLNPTWAIRRIDAAPAAIELVRGGMLDAVMHDGGTAKRARVPGVAIAGKTGSAQYRKVVDGEVADAVHAWMISFAPFDFPRYAVAILIEDGVSGGNTVGPRLAALYRNLFAYDGTIGKGGG